MSISSEISRISGNVSNAYTAIDDMGGTVPSSANSGNLATAIRSIPQSGGGGGFTPTVLTCVADFSDATATDSGFHFETTLTSGTYAAALAAIEAGTPAVLKFTLQATEDGTTTPMGEGNVFLALLDDEGYISGGVQLGESGTIGVTLSNNGSVFIEMNVPDAEVVWVSCQVDLATYTVSNFSKTHAEIAQAVLNDKIVKIKVLPSTGGVALGDLNNYVDANSSMIFGFLMKANLGAGDDILFGEIALLPNDTNRLSIFKTNSTQII